MLVTKGYYANVTIVDLGGNKSTLRYDIVGIDLTTAQANAATLVADLALITKGTIVSYTVGELFQEDTLTVGGAGSEVENIALVVAQLEGTPGQPTKYHSFRIPAPVDSLFLGVSGETYNQVNIASAALLTYLGHFTNTTLYPVPGTTNAIALVSGGEKIAASTVLSAPVIKNGKRIHRASRKG